MSERVRYTRPSERSTQHKYESKDAVSEQEKGRRYQDAARKSGKLAVEASDELMDEIDEILEENAEEFVANWVQKGGQ